MTTPKHVDSGSRSNSQEMEVEPIAQVGEAIDVIDSVNDYTTIWNKRQCQRILKLFAEIGERLKSLDWDRQDDADPRKAVDGGPIYDELVRLLQKGKALVSGYAAGKIGIANVLSRTDNRDAFSEFYKELNDVMAKLGFQGVEEDVEPSTAETTGLLEKLTMTNEAEEDKKEMSEIFSQMLTSGEAMDYSEKLTKVVSDKTVEDVNDNFLALSDESVHAGASSTGAMLPSYLCIDLKSDIVKGEPIRKYMRKSKRDPEEQVGWVVVYSGTWLGIEYAIKVFNCRSKDAAADWNRRQLLKEVGSLVKLQHPHVVRFVGFGQDEDESILVMEKMDGNIREFMELRTNSTPERKKPFKASEELDIVNQIAKGMYFMHTIGYVHGDLKCSNIVYKNYANKCLEIKLSDLRGSQKLDPVSNQPLDPKAIAEASKTRRPRWTAPEGIDHFGGVEPSGELLKQNDVYSFGMTCYEIVTGKYPFHGITEEPKLLEHIKEGAAEKWNPLPLELDDDFKGLIISCWDKEPSKRPNFGLICHRLDIIRSKGLAAKNILSVVATMLSGIMRIPAVSQIPEQSRETGAHNKRFKSSHCFDTASLALPNDSRVLSAPEYLSIRREDLEISEDVIGEGTSGTVRKATWLKSTFAVKILKQRYSADLKQEVDFLMQVSRHPCIVQMVGLSRNANGENSIVMEYMDFNLRTLIKTRMEKKPETAKPFTFPEEVLIITQIAWGMVYLHSRGLVHRDLNSLNVLAQDYSPIVVVKIVDFGRSYLEGSSNSSETTPGFYTGMGTSCFRAPEMLKFNPDSNEELPEGLPDHSAKADLSALKATDVYSFAMLCYEVLTGRCPCDENKSKPMTDYAAWRNYRPQYWPENSDTRLKSLVEKCWRMNQRRDQPSERFALCFRANSKATSFRLNPKHHVSLYPLDIRVFLVFWNSEVLNAASLVRVT